MDAELRAGRSLRTAMGWAVAGQLIYIASQFGVLVALTRFGTLADVGRFGLVMAIATPIVTLFGLGLREALATDAAGDYKITEYFRMRIVSSVLAWPAMVAAGVLFTGDHATIMLMAVIALTKIAESQSEVYYGCFQGQGRLDLVARSLILRGPLGMVLFIALLWYSRSPNLAFGSQVFCWTAVALLHDRPLAYALTSPPKTRWDWSRLRRLAREMFSLAFGLTVARTTTAVPRFAINAVLGTEALGLFTAVSYVWQAGMTGLQQANNALAAPLAQAWHRGNLQRFRALMRNYALFFGALFLLTAGGALFAGEWFVITAFGPKYREGAVLFALMFVILAVQSATVVYTMGVVSQRQFKPFAAVRLILIPIVAICTSVGAWLGGLNGAGWGVVASAMAQFIGTYLVLRRGIAARANMRSADQELERQTQTASRDAAGVIGNE